VYIGLENRAEISQPDMTDWGAIYTQPLLYTLFAFLKKRGINQNNIPIRN